MSLSHYYKGFISVLGGLTSLLTALPLIAAMLPNPIGSYVFPPLGDLEPVARIGSVASAVLGTYVVYFLRSQKASRCVLLAALLAFVSFVGYIVLYFAFVKKVDIPAEKTAVCVSVGYERTEFAKKEFIGRTDTQMLRDRGLDDEAIGQLWAAKSVLVARLSLWTSFTLSLTFFVAALGFGIKSQQAQNDARRGTAPRGRTIAGPENGGPML